MLLSIDFEDFNHDLKRSLGLSTTQILKTDALWEKYTEINSFLKKYNTGEGKYCTFFCAGIIAAKFPDLIRQIAKDGHEIGCHYYYHDDMRKQSFQTLKLMLLKSKNILEETSNQKVHGFRAPNFAINKESPEQYQLIEDIFSYDSSFHCSSLKDLTNFKNKMNLSKLLILPIFSKYIFKKSLRLGGTYFKIFPYSYTKYMCKEAIKYGFEPHIYLHPYEFNTSKEFKVHFNELKKIGLIKSIYWNIRQKQWLELRNKDTLKKLIKLIKENPLKGKLINQNFLN